MQYTNEGIVLAQPIAGKYGISESGENKLTTFSADFLVTHYKAEGDQWVALDGEHTVTGWFYMEKKDGTLNTNTIDKLKSVFGWNGADPFWLQDTDLSQTQVQLTLQNETYNNRVRLKVQWIDVPGAEGPGVKRTEGDARRALADRVGSKFRANAGGVAVGPPKPAGRPAPVTPTTAPVAAVAPPVAAAPPSLPPAANPPTAEVPPNPITIAWVWDRWQAACKDAKDAAAQWKQIVAPMFPGVIQLKDEHALRIWEEAFSKIVPF